MMNDSYLVGLPPEAIGADIAMALEDASGVRPLASGANVWLLRRRGMCWRVAVVPAETGSRVSLAVTISRPALKKLITFALWAGTVMAWLVASIATFADFRGPQTPERLVWWLGGLGASLVLTPLAIRSLRWRRVDVSSELWAMERFGAALARIEAEHADGGYRRPVRFVAEATAA